MSNMDDFFKSEIPTMILNAIAETAKNYSAKEPNINIKAKPNYKIPIEDLVKKSSELIGKEACKAADDFAAKLYYTYLSLINAGFSVTQAFELIGYTLIG